MCVCDVSWKPEENVGCCGGDGVTGDCEPSQVWGTELCFPERAASVLNLRAVSPGPVHVHFAVPDEKKLDQVVSKHITGTEGDRRPLINGRFGKQHW